MNITHTILATVGSIIVMFAISKLLGNKQISQLTLFDYINGITIGQDYADGVLQEWYVENVAGGQDAFVINATTFADFGNALELKLAAEIEGGIIPEGALAAPIEAAQLLLGMPLLLAWRYQRRNQGRLQPANGQLAPAIG